VGWLWVSGLSPQNPLIFCNCTTTTYSERKTYCRRMFYAVIGGANSTNPLHESAAVAFCGIVEFKPTVCGRKDTAKTLKRFCHVVPDNSSGVNLTVILEDAGADPESLLGGGVECGWGYTSPPEEGFREREI